MEPLTGVSADMTPLNEWATKVHELFVVLQKAGFTPSEAITLIAGIAKPGETD